MKDIYLFQLDQISCQRNKTNKNTDVSVDYFLLIRPVQEPISKKIRLEETPTVTPQPQVKKKGGRPVGSNKQKKKNKKIQLFLSPRFCYN
ncbi:hypothetical protein BpHYR1_003768 [Brachionus plicatilis]|uniref:Uncharacterized protein n=1 Tax=Brachionus plicatilis TaxID=10195 RepID=A0A3M7PZV1_BRAPC|nr:hypothetical protein BpHYR1_003768 [Brachionus plicatilis]